MSPGASKSSLGTRYLYYRCTNHACTRKKKSIRAKVVFDFIYGLLEGGIELSEKEYQYYYDQLTSHADKAQLDQFRVDNLIAAMFYAVISSK